MSDPAIDAPGWAAIDAIVGGQYPGQTPHQFTSRTPYELDKASPLPAITVWESKVPPSWHYVTYGLTELFEKSSPNQQQSGFGFELTLRLPRGDEDAPPIWGLRLLQALGGKILYTKQGFDSGATVNFNGPITPDGGTDLTGLVILPDPMLGKFPTPHGTVLFLQVVGVTDDELKIFHDAELEPFVATMAELTPSGLTDISRTSWVQDPDKGKVMRRLKVGLKL